MIKFEAEAGRSRLRDLKTPPRPKNLDKNSNEYVSVFSKPTTPVKKEPPTQMPKIPTAKYVGAHSDRQEEPGILEKIASLFAGKAEA